MNRFSFLDEIVEVLRDRTGASRVTARLALLKPGLEVNDVAAEALVGKVPSMRGQTSMKQRTLSSVVFLEREQQMLIQEKYRVAQPPMPKRLVEEVGVKAQMLVPLITDGRLVDWISVHECTGPRKWSSEDRSAATEAAQAVLATLAKAWRKTSAACNSPAPHSIR